MSKVILVTGSNTGLGFEIVRILAEKGHVVYLSARNEVAGLEAQSKLKNDGLNVKFVRIDVTDISTITAARDVIQRNEGHLDVLVNNAGVGLLDQNQNALTVSLDTIRTAFEANFFGLVQTTQAFIPLLRASKQGVITNVTTHMGSNTFMASDSPFSNFHVTAYNTSKAAANSYTIALAYELKADGIKVNSVGPGQILTKLNNFREGGKTPREGAETIVPHALLDKDGPTGRFYSFDGKELSW